MKTIDVRVTDEQLQYLQKISGRKSVVNVLTDMVMEMLDKKMEADNGKTTVN